MCGSGLVLRGLHLGGECHATGLLPPTLSNDHVGINVVDLEDAHDGSTTDVRVAVC